MLTIPPLEEIADLVIKLGWVVLSGLVIVIIVMAIRGGGVEGPGGPKSSG